ncbi:SRPBCC family protein [Mucilaginibacter pedocola]|uniref:Activator of Hsp90 ATPase homologue 1/2-like C-terminal domain-containing protein n=1 Tax=Mucilaginibacter pedocola TaxID=1792845 RepID=A0A1S9P6I8_9SPHI|nr:SRPBCC domain-containing protein [Mucilaginibacter pedocola]OOQ56562.1 hypothetical protein BC343_19195 [Mucilaginibacter pedocola]
MTNNFVFETNAAAKSMHAEREFNAPVEQVWKAFTEPALLDKWWGSKPFTTETTSMDFTVGGSWHYAMVAPDGQKYPSKSTFTAIEPGSRFAADTGVGHWDNKFIAVGGKTRVVIDITFEDEASLQMMLDMGFENGTATSFNQLEELLAADAVSYSL